MEDCSLSVEELSICFGDNKAVETKKDFAKEEEDDLHFGSKKNVTENKPSKSQETNEAESPSWSRPNLQKIPGRYPPLPSLGQAKDGSLAESFERNRVQQDAVWSLCTALNVPSKEQSQTISSSDSQLHLCAKRTEYKQGKVILAPLHDRKQQHSQQGGNESSVLKQQQSPTKGKQCRKSDKDEAQFVHFTPISKAPSFGQEECLYKAEDYSQYAMSRPKGRFLSPLQGSKEDVDLDIQHSRRFSMPVSPRLLRRLHREKQYTSQKTDGSVEYQEKQTYPERSSIFSPPLKDFDSFQDKTDEDEDDFKSKVKSGNRRSLDLNSGTNSLRFLSEIKVSLEKEPSGFEPVLPKAKTKPEKRKDSYSLSAPSEAILKTSLPEVVQRTTPKHVQSSGRVRSSTFTSLEVAEPRILEKTTLESPLLLLGVGTKRLSHLSLSPRLSRKR